MDLRKDVEDKVRGLKGKIDDATWKKAADHPFVLAMKALADDYSAEVDKLNLEVKKLNESDVRDVAMEEALQIRYKIITDDFKRKEKQLYKEWHIKKVI